MSFPKILGASPERCPFYSHLSAVPHWAISFKLVGPNFIGPLGGMVGE